MESGLQADGLRIGAIHDKPGSLLAFEDWTIAPEGRPDISRWRNHRTRSPNRSSSPGDLAKWHTARGSLKFLWFSMLMGLSLWGKTSPFSVGQERLQSNRSKTLL